MSEIIVKLKDPRKIAWDQVTGAVITGPDPVTIEETHFIRAKINEGVLVEAKPNKTETTSEQKAEADAKIVEAQNVLDKAKKK